MLPTVETVMHTCLLGHKGELGEIEGLKIKEPKDLPPLLIIAGKGDCIAENLWKSLKPLLYQEGHRAYFFCFNRKSHYTSLEAVVLDLIQVAAWVRHLERGKKILVLTAELECLPAIFFAKAYPRFCKGMVMINPLLNPSHQPSPGWRFLIRLFGELFPKDKAPTWLLRNALPISEHLPNLKMSHLLLKETVAAISQIKKNISRIHMPFFILATTEYEDLKQDLKKIQQKHLDPSLFHYRRLSVKEEDLRSPEPVDPQEPNPFHEIYAAIHLGQKDLPNL